MFGPARPACGGSADLGFAEPFGKKWKQDRSCLTELAGTAGAPGGLGPAEAEGSCGFTAQVRRRSSTQTGSFPKSCRRSWR